MPFPNIFAHYNPVYNGVNSTVDDIGHFSKLFLNISYTEKKVKVSIQSKFFHPT